MAHLRDDIIFLVKELITNVTHFQDNTVDYNHIQEYVISKLRSADSMYFITKKDIDGIVAGISEKFIFHGFSSQAKDLVKCYENFIPATLTRHDANSKLNIMKLLLCLSESPTNNFMNSPNAFIPIVNDEVIDWPAYLKEGIDRWSPPVDETSDSWSDDTQSEVSYVLEQENKASGDNLFILSQALVPVKNHWEEYLDVKKNLCTSAQQSWFTKDHVYMLPISRNIDANIAIHWDAYLEHSARGLVNIQKPSIITEYKAMREVLWQLWEPHTSYVYQIIGDCLVPRQNVTISSVRSVTFERFMHEFLPYVKLLQTLKDFHNSLSLEDGSEAVIPETYRSYDCAVNNIIKPSFDKLLSLEYEIMAQESVMTLIKLAHRLRAIFENGQILKSIHDSVILDFKTNTPVHCATTLLSRLHVGLLHCVSKNEQDIYMSIYLDSLYKYFGIINSWLNNDALNDLTEEFVLIDENPKDPHVLCNSIVTKSENNTSVNSSKNERGHPDWQMEFVIRDLDEFSKADSLLKIIYTEVLQIGKNIHLLRLLGKLHLLKDSSNTDSLHNELISRVLEEIAIYFKSSHHLHLQKENVEVQYQDSNMLYKYPVICRDSCKYPTHMDRLENLVDTSDGFQMNAFASFFTEDTKTDVLNKETLYERISNATKNIFPAKQIIDDVFLRILKERYVESGYMVKSLLISDYKIEKHFELLKHIFLFKDDIIYLLYRRLFKQIELNNWGNDVWLTTQLQDIIMDMYPDFYEKCSVEVQENWRLCNDPLQACTMVNISYRIKWPINIIIRDEHMKMYSELFQLILHIKWGLYTLNHLYFNEVEPKKKPKKQHKAYRELVRRLKVLRFCLLNEFSSIQHYILGYVYSNCAIMFHDDFDKAHSLNTLIASHEDFINRIYTISIFFRDFNDKSYGFYLLLYLVQKLSIMWRNLKDIDDAELARCELNYRRCHEYLNPIMYPKNILDK